MDRERTAQDWLIEATPSLRCVTGAERRFSASLKANEVTVLAAADELGSSRPGCDGLDDVEHVP